MAYRFGRLARQTYAREELMKDVATKKDLMRISTDELSSLRMKYVYEIQMRLLLNIIVKACSCRRVSWVVVWEVIVRTCSKDLSLSHTK